MNSGLEELDESQPLVNNKYMRSEIDLPLNKARGVGHAA